MSNSNPDLKKLQALAPRLLDGLCPPNHFNNPDGFVNYEVPGGGTCFGLKSYFDGEGLIASQRIFITKGTLFPEHRHEESELAIAYTGKIIFFIGEDKKEQILIPGSVPVFFLPNVKHSAKALVDTWLYCITVPADKGYPQ